MLVAAVLLCLRAFIVTNNESKANWVDQDSTHPQSFTLTVLYGAKPDGSAWVKNDKTDGNAKGEGGYTNLEIYMNALVADITNAQNEGGELLGTTLPDETASLKENRLYPIDSRGNGFYYTLQGIRTTTPINGIYIQNGHKVIVK